MERQAREALWRLQGDTAFVRGWYSDCWYKKGALVLKNGRLSRVTRDGVGPPTRVLSEAAAMKLLNERREQVYALKEE